MQIVELEMVPLSLRPVLQRLYDMKTTQSALREGVLFSTKRNNYYYDTGTGKVIVLDDDTSYIFRVLFDPALSAETFLISLTKVDPNAVKNLLQTIDAERLFQRPPLLSMGKEIAAGVTDTEQKVEQIILEVTEQCNFRCKYCVYSEDFSGNRDFGNRRMPTEIAFKAIDWALENSGAKLAITFYGGEPLLNFKLMKAVIERSQAKRGNKEIVYSEIQDNQTFSIAGTRKGFGDPRGTLFFELARLAEARKPPYLLFENVPYALLHIRYIMSCKQLCKVSFRK